jgi:hypothetical protein
MGGGPLGFPVGISDANGLIRSAGAVPVANSVMSARPQTTSVTEGCAGAGAKGIHEKRAYNTGGKDLAGHSGVARLPLAEQSYLSRSLTRDGACLFGSR